MDSVLKRGLGMALALSLCFLAACGPGPQGGSPLPGAQPAAMGRYVEEELTLPQDLLHTLGMHSTGEGALELLGFVRVGESNADCRLWRSFDHGQSWEAAPFAGMPDDLALPDSAAWDEEGSLYIVYTQYTQEYMDAMEAMDDGAFELDDSIPAPVRRIMKISPDGRVEDLPWELPEANAGVYAMAVSGGRLFFSDYTSVHQLDLATGREEAVYEMQNAQTVAGFLPFAGWAAVIDGSEVILYDLETGEKSDGFSVSPALISSSSDPSHAYFSDASAGSSIMAADEDALYFCTSRGIYRRLGEGSVLEQVVDGSLTSLGFPSMSVRHLLVEEDRFCVLLLDEQTDSYLLRSYRYDPDIPTVPTQELNIWSLRDNKTVRQAAGLFQLQNPDVRVTLETALSPDSAMTAADALRALNTRLLGGGGPDLLILDGISAQPYMEKGALADLTALVEGHTRAGDWFPNIAEAFRDGEGRIRALPARFSVPLLLGDEAVLGATGSFGDMADYLARWHREHPGLQTLEFCKPSILINTFYPVCAPGWFREDGSLDREGMAEFLAAVKAVAETEDAEELAAQYAHMPEDFTLQPDWGILGWHFGFQALGAGVAAENQVFATLAAAAEAHGGGGAMFFPSQRGSVFVPQSVVGVNSAGAHQELALRFVEALLSPQVQAGRFADGFPVNLEAFRQNLQSPYPQGGGMSYGTGFAGEDYFLKTSWFTAEEGRQLLEAFRTLDLPVPDNLAIRELILRETAGYFDGSVPLEDTVTVLSEKLDLLLAE